MKSEPTEINPELLKSLGRVVPTMPPDRPTVNPETGSKPFSIIEPLNPPRQYDYGVDLKTPTKK